MGSLSTRFTTATFIGAALAQSYFGGASKAHAQTADLPLNNPEVCIETPTPTATPTPCDTVAPTSTPTPIATSTATPTPTASPSPTVAPDCTETPVATVTPSPTREPAAPTVTPTATPTVVTPSSIDPKDCSSSDHTADIAAVDASAGQLARLGLNAAVKLGKDSANKRVQRLANKLAKVIDHEHMEAWAEAWSWPQIITICKTLAGQEGCVVDKTPTKEAYKENLTTILKLNRRLLNELKRNSANRKYCAKTEKESKRIYNKAIGFLNTLPDGYTDPACLKNRE